MSAVERGIYTVVSPLRTPAGLGTLFRFDKKAMLGVAAMDRWTIELVVDHVIARVDGDLDLANSRDLVDFLGRLSALSEYPVEVDLSGVDFIDSSGLHALLTAHRLLLERNSTLTIVNPSPCARRLLELTGCTEIFRVVHRDVDLPVATD